MGRFSEIYLQSLLNDKDYGSLVDIQSIIVSWSGFNPDLPLFGLPSFAFVFVETLSWFAQTERSGGWTYFESTPKVRQGEMLSALEIIGPISFAEQYKFGMSHWRDVHEMKKHDTWADENQNVSEIWLRGVVLENFLELQLLCS